MVRLRFGGGEDSLEHFRDSPESVPGLFQKCPGTVPKVSRDCPESVSKDTQYFDRIFEMHEFGVVGGPKYIFFNILIQSNIPEQSGSIGTRVEQYGFSLVSTLNWMTLSNHSDYRLKNALKH